MQDWFDVAKKLESLAFKAAQRANLDAAVFFPDVHPADPRFGDAQINGALPYAKRLKTNPREIAQQLVEQLNQDPEITSVAELSIAGPGFINIRFKSEFFLKWLRALFMD